VLFGTGNSRGRGGETFGKLVRTQKGSVNGGGRRKRGRGGEKKGNRNRRNRAGPAAAPTGMYADLAAINRGEGGGGRGGDGRLCCVSGTMHRTYERDDGIYRRRGSVESVQRQIPAIAKSWIAEVAAVSRGDRDDDAAIGWGRSSRLNT